MDRFWSKVQKTDGCWLWTAALGSHGYGAFHLDGGMRLAHRVAYTLLAGPIPDDRTLDHLCRNTRCVNPDHLEPVPHVENVRRGHAGHHNRSKRTCPRGHPYDAANTDLRDGKRFCRACRTIHSAKRDKMLASP